jgi:hypothetical protein
MPAVVTRSFAVTLSGRLVGAVIFTAGARHAHRVIAGAPIGAVITLGRLWLDDAVPTNGESRVLGVVLRQLRRERRHLAVVTFADPAAGHSGTIYRAAGFRYLGQQPPSAVLVIDGRVVHTRTAVDRYGTNSAPHLRRTGIPARRVTVPGKHRYLAVLDRNIAWRVSDAHRERAPPR